MKSLYEIFANITFNLQSNNIVGIKEAANQPDNKINKIILYYDFTYGTRLIRDYSLLRTFRYKDKFIFNVKNKKITPKSSSIYFRCLEITLNDD